MSRFERLYAERGVRRWLLSKVVQPNGAALSAHVEGICRPELMAAAQTLGIVNKVQPQNGVCRNVDPIPDFTECQGSCESSTYFNPKTIRYQSDCFCWKYRQILVELGCEDGLMLSEMITVPSDCACQGCVEAAAPAKRPGVKG